MIFSHENMTFNTSNKIMKKPITSSNSSVIFRMISEFCICLNISALTAPIFQITQWQ